MRERQNAHPVQAVDFERRLADGATVPMTIFAQYDDPLSDVAYLAVLAACLHGQTVLCAGRVPFTK